MAEVISNVGNRYVIGKEVTYGTMPGVLTALDFGHIQTISIDEDETTEATDSMNSGHTPIGYDDGVYNVSGTIVSKVTKSALPNILEALFGAIADTSLDTYTATTDPISSDDLSYAMKFNTQVGEIMEMTGISITGGEIAVVKDDSTEITMNFTAQVLLPSTETLTPVSSIGSRFMGLDATVSYDGNTTILDNFNFTLDWNIDEGDSRGIEVAHSNGRRVIKRVIRNNLTLSGNFESQMDANIDTGYLDERSDVDIVLTLDRGADNSHVFTFETSSTNTRSRELSNDNTSKKISCDFQSVDVTAVGDK